MAIRSRSDANRTVHKLARRRLRHSALHRGRATADGGRSPCAWRRSMRQRNAKPSANAAGRTWLFCVFGARLGCVRSEWTSTVEPWPQSIVAVWTPAQSRCGPAWRGSTSADKTLRDCMPSNTRRGRGGGDCGQMLGPCRRGNGGDNADVRAESMKAGHRVCRASWGYLPRDEMTAPNRLLWVQW